jgi:hypothetical protein
MTDAQKSDCVALAAMMERVKSAPGGVQFVTDLFLLCIIPQGLRIATIEDVEDAAEAILDSANYLKENLDAGREVYESKWLDGLMQAHGALLEIAESTGAP